MGGSDLEDITLENLQTLQEKLEMGLRSARVREVTKITCLSECNYICSSDFNFFQA
jgi:hypothetical protein